LDFITHCLMGVGAARVVSPRREWFGQLSLTVVGVNAMMDADMLVGIKSFALWGSVHRVQTHSLIGMCAIVLAASAVAWLCFGRFVSWRRRGWMVGEKPLEEAEPSRTPWALMLFCAALAAGLHWCGDVVTGYGNMMPLWPWSRIEVSISAVLSFDWAIFSATLAWHVLIRTWEPGRGREGLVGVCYALLVVGYVMAKWLWGETAII